MEDDWELPGAVSFQGNMYLQALCFKGNSITHHVLGWEMSNRGQCKWWHLWNKKSHLTAILLHLEHIEEINHEGSKKNLDFWNPSLGNSNSMETQKMDSGHWTHLNCSGIRRTSAIIGSLGLARRNDGDNRFWLNKAVIFESPLANKAHSLFHYSYLLKPQMSKINFYLIIVTKFCFPRSELWEKNSSFGFLWWRFEKHV